MPKEPQFRAMINLPRPIIRGEPQGRGYDVAAALPHFQGCRTADGGQRALCDCEGRACALWPDRGKSGETVRYSAPDCPG